MWFGLWWLQRSQVHCPGGADTSSVELREGDAVTTSFFDSTGSGTERADDSARRFGSGFSHALHAMAVSSLWHEQTAHTKTSADCFETPSDGC